MAPKCLRLRAVHCISLTNRANDWSTIKSSLGQAALLLKSTDNAINSATELVEQAKTIAQSANDIASVTKIGMTSQTDQA